MTTQSSKIRAYWKKNPSATPKQIAQELGVNIYTVYYVNKKRRMARKKKVIDLSAADLLIPPNPRLIGSENAMPRPKARLATSADFKITDKTEFIMPDPVNHPSHYTVGGIETIDFIEAKKLNYNLGNAVKYITRADHKGARQQDLEKARWYIEREILSSHIK